MFPILPRLVFLLLFSFHLANAYVSYANAFVNPDWLLAGNFSDNTLGARQTIKAWATQLAAEGPWTVTNKTVLAPSGDKHDYMSWAPYSWPNCTAVGNTTVLPLPEVWSKCPYYLRDGVFNPDFRTINDIGSFQAMSEAIFYNAIAWALAGRPTSLYVNNAVNFIRTWFLDPETKMNPNLKYAQMHRGPKGQLGGHTGILDLKGFTKIACAILIFRKGGSTTWTSDLDSQMQAWAKQYIQWLETWPTAVEESHAPNNHGSFYHNQLSALKLLVNDTAGAINVTNTYLRNQFSTQIDGDGEQTNAQIVTYLNKSSNVWFRRAKSGATIKDALDYTMLIPPGLKNETSHQQEIDPNVAAVMAIWGDPDNHYLDFLRNFDQSYASQPYWFWSQPDAQNPGAPPPQPSQSSALSRQFVWTVGPQVESDDLAKGLLSRGPGASERRSLRL
ncbi:alginate lyase-domain-containing protein [Hysterangium stoloniferum]|nr:alginate lyase-domain-containing protein [Hysterangium stoloniferum]